MIGMPFNLQVNKGVFELVSSDFSSPSSISSSGKWKKQKENHHHHNSNSFACGGGGGGGFGSEPTSVLDSRRSPSTPTTSTSTTTLSSSLGGGGSTGSTDTASVAAVSDNPLQKWPPTTATATTQEEDNNSAGCLAASEPQGGCSSGGGSGGGSSNGGGKDEWVSELQPVPSTLEIISSSGGVNGGGGGGSATGNEKYGGLGMEDWDSMLSETAASPSLLRWIIDDVEDPSSGLLQGGGGGAVASEFEGNAGFGIVDPSGFGFEPTINGVSTGGSAMNSMNHHPSLSLPLSSSGFLSPNNGSRLSLNSIQNPNPSSTLPNFNKVPCFAASNPSSNHEQVFSPSSNTLPLNLPLPLSLPPGMFYQHQQQQNQFDMADEKPQLFNPQQLLLNQNNQKNTNPPFYMPLAAFNNQQQDQQQQQHLLSPQLKRHHSSMVDPTQIQKPPFMDSGQELFLRRQQQQQQQGFPHQLQLLPNHHQLQQRPLMASNNKPKVVVDEITHHQQQQALVDQLFKAAELVESGNSIHAQGILARLNQLSPVGAKPLQRASFYFKEALQLLLLHNNNNNVNVGTSPPPPPHHRNSTPLDVVQKIGAYKSFSEISPLLQFSNFTCNQALLEELDQYDHIHIIDFDIGIGGQWASFMQEIAMRMNGSPSLKITAFASPSTSHDHPLELVLTREHLTHFANDLGISFEIDIVSLDSFDPSSWSLPLHVSESEAVAVNLPIGSSSIHPSSLPSLLRLVKQLSPKIVVSMDRGCDRSDLPFSHHFLQALQSYSILLDSLDATNADPKVISKIEQFLLQPRIESTIMRRHRAAHEKLPPWRTLFASAGFSPLTFSNFTETQAECLVKRLQGRGFHVEKRQGASLVLCWQRRELVSASAWRC